MAESRDVAGWGGAPDREGAERIPRLGEIVDLIEQRFDREGVLGILRVDTSFVSQVERRSGSAASASVLDAFCSAVAAVADDRLDLDDMVVRGDMGRDEIVVLLFRESRDSRFYRHELPGFAQALGRELESGGTQRFFPHLRELPELVTGMAVGIRNSHLDIEHQLVSVLSEARTDSALEARIQARRSRQSFLEMLLDRGVTSVYEPIVEVESRTVFGYEALARGPKESPYHSPLTLFSIAERENLVFELDCICRASGLTGAVDFPSGTKLFLNILPTTIHDPNFREEKLIKTLEECALCPSDVVFEISEQESIESFAAFKEMRDYYRRLGFRFALDDTGSGYAGLEALLEIQPEFIKVDRAFVSGVDQDLTRQNMLRALLDIARESGAQVIGEGLDTIEELEMLKELGIHFGQGWLFGKPTPLRAG